ncbi:calcium-binding protein [Bradyrhizobium yuanmingense]|uniref:calcium-binding protein n=1 Tax=Bradyrhizobium yuanmingense TaxID=108015 RepID=UPI001CD2519F|nr:calcium-binding protein [Bradyrhizobium yuanmingense]MCA1529442.1 VCBS domain-containing protein [Bradyrhizobium yuanmingense]
MAEDGQTIHIYQTDSSHPGWTPAVNSQQANVSDRYTGFNLTAASAVKYINSDGVVVAADPSLVLIHEIEHALTGDRDPSGDGPRGLPLAISSPGFDFQGKTVAFQNEVAVQIGEPDKVELSYNAVAAPGSFSYDKLQLGVDFTPDASVDFVVIQQNAGMNTLNFASYERVIRNSNGTVSETNSPADELLIAFTGTNHLVSGAGSDFLYGGTGRDTFIAGAGNNYINGGQPGIAAADDGIDTVDYTRAFFPIKISDQGVSAGEIVVSDNGYAPLAVDGNGQPTAIGREPFQDRLVSIESIVGTSGDDELTITDVTLSGRALTNGKLTIDGKGGTNTATIFSPAHVIEHTDGSVGFDDSGLLLKNFSKIQLGGGADYVKVDLAYSFGGSQSSYQSSRTIDMGGGSNTLDLTGLDGYSFGSGIGNTVGFTTYKGVTNFEVGTGYFVLSGEGVPEGQAITVNVHGNAVIALSAGHNWIVNGNGSAGVIVDGATTGFSGTPSSLSASDGNGHVYQLNGVTTISRSGISVSTPDGLLNHSSSQQTIFLSQSTNPGASSGFYEFTDVDPYHDHVVTVEGGASFATVTATIYRESWWVQDVGGPHLSENGVIAYTATFNEPTDRARSAIYDIVLTNSAGDRIVQSISITQPGSLFPPPTTVDSAPAVGAVTESYETSFDGEQTLSGSFSFTGDSAGLYTATVGFTHGPGTSFTPLGGMAVEVAGNTVQWNYSIEEVALQSLAENTTLNERYVVYLVDQNGIQATKNIDITLNSRTDKTIITGTSSAAAPIIQGSTPDGRHVVSGTIDFADADPRDIHVISTSTQGTMPGQFNVQMVSDTTGGGAGHLAWTYKVTDAELGTFPSSYSGVYTITIDDGHGHQQALPSAQVTLSALAVAPSAAPVMTAPSTMVLWAGGYANYATNFTGFIDPDTFVRHTISVSYDGSMTAAGTLSATLYDTSSANPNGSYSLVYTVDPAILDAMQDGQTITETWHVRLEDVGYCLAAEQDQTIIIVRENATVVDQTSVFGSTIEAGAAPSSWDQPAGGFLFNDGNALDVHTVTSSFKSSSTGSGPLGSFFTNMPYDTLNSPFGSGVLLWNYDASEVTSHSHVAQTVTEVWTVNLDDGHGGVTSQDVTITIEIPGTGNQVPVVIAADLGTIDENAALLAVNLLQGASDADGDTLTVVAGSLAATASDGRTVQVSIENGVAAIDPAQFKDLGEGQAITLSFGYDVTDGIATTHGTATLEVQGLNDAPHLAATSHSASQNDAPTSINLLAAASDQDAGDVVSLVAGDVSVVASDGHLVAFTQTASGLTIDPSQFAYLGQGEYLDLSVTYSVTDGIATAIGDQTITIAGAEDAPTIAAISAGTASERDAVRSIDLLLEAIDIDQDAILSVVSPSLAMSSSDGHTVAGTLTGGTLALDPGQFRYLHAGQSAVVTVDYDVTDGIVTVHNTATLTVTGVDSPPTISTIAAGSVDQNDAVKSIDLLQTAADPDGNATLTVVGSSLSIAAADGRALAYSLVDGVLEIDPSQFAYLRAGQTNLLTVGYDVTDGDNTVHNTATLTIVGEDDPAAAPARVLGGVAANGSTFSFNGLTGVATPDQGAHTYSIVAGSATASSSDGHAVAAGISGSNITLNPTQFKYLGAGESVTVTIGYDVAVSGQGTTAPPGHISHDLLVIGTNDLPIVTSIPATSISDTAAPDLFAPVTGTLLATDPDVGDTQFWTPQGYAQVESVIVGNWGAMLVRPDGFFVYIPCSQRVATLYSGSISSSFSVQVDDGFGGIVYSAIPVVTVGVNDSPYDVYFSSAGATPGGAVLEQAANGTAVGTLKYNDPDAGGNGTWTLIDNAGGRFALSTSGTLTVANGALLTHADIAGYDIVVKGTSSTGEYVQQTMHVDLMQLPTATSTGTSAADTMTGTAGDDVIIARAGNDTINAGNGDDIVLPGVGTNSSDGGAGVDTVSYVDNTFAIVANLATGVVSRYSGAGDVSTNFENLVATSFDDTVYGTLGDNIIWAGAGNDKIYERGGHDVIDGGTGADRAYFDEATSAVLVDLQTGTTGGAAAETTLINIEGVVGGSGNDTLTGLSSIANYLAGGAGDDVLTGGSAKDTFDGGLGHDTVYGSLGSDTISDIDDLVLDYSAALSSIVLYSTGAYAYFGMGGFADGDTVTFGDAAHQGLAKLELRLPDSSSGVRLNPYDINIVYAGAGDDNIHILDSANFAVQSKETIYGGAGYDIIHPGNDGYDFVDFGSGGGILDYQFANGYVNFQWAEPGGTSTVQVFSGTSSTNIADHGFTTVVGDFETFEGSAGADTIHGNSQANTIFGNGGSDIIDADGGNDRISAVGTIHGGAGNDQIFITGAPTTGAGTANIYGDDGNDAIMLGTTVKDVVIWGGAGDDAIDASAGNALTIVHGGAGADLIRMNSTETLSYADATAAIAVNGLTGTAGDALGDTIFGAPKIVGSNFGDVFQDTAFELHLGTGNNTATNNTGAVYGNTGNDTVIGTSNADNIHSGGGHDVFQGGLGSDKFYFDHIGADDTTTLQYAYGDGADTIYTFLHGQDSIDIQRLAGSSADPTVTATVSGANTTVHIVWDTTHSANITLSGVQMSSFALGQDYHLL